MAILCLDRVIFTRFETAARLLTKIVFEKSENHFNDLHQFFQLFSPPFLMNWSFLGIDVMSEIYFHAVKLSTSKPVFMRDDEP